MAVRHYTQITTVKGDLFKIEIDDSGWGGGSTEILSGSGEGFTLSYPTALEKFPGLMPSEFRYWVAIQNNGQGNLITDMASYAEGRFRLNCYKWVSSAWVLWWGGVVSPNIAEYDDLSYPYVFEISAVDGLGQLANIDYNDAGAAYTGESTLIDIVAKILKKLPYAVSLWTGSTDWIRTIVDYYEDSMTYNAANCPLYYTKVNERAFFTVNSKGIKVWMKCDKVLTNIVQMFNCQMYQTQGKWLIQQIDERTKTSFNARKYAYTIAAPTAAASMYGSKAIDPGDPTPRLTGGKYDWLPALKKVIVNYNAQDRRNYIGGETWDQSHQVQFNAGNVDGSNGTTSVRVTGTITASFLNNSVAAGTLFYPRWKIRIKVGTNYLVRTLTVTNNQISASTPIWTTVAGDYQWTTGITQAPSIGTSMFTSGNIDVLSPFLTVSGDLLFNIDFDEVFLGDMTPTWSLLNNGFNFVEVISNGYGVTVANDASYEMVQPDGSGTEIYEIETVIADGVTENSAGRLIIGSAGSSDWGLGGGAYDKPLVELLMTQLLKGQDKPRKRMRGSVFGLEFPIYYILDDGGDEWVFTGGTFTATNNTWQGEWIKLDPGSATYDPPIIKSTDTYTPTNAPGLSNPGGLGSSGLQNLTPATLEPLTAAKTSAVKTAGAVTSIPVTAALSARAFVNGQVLSLVNPANGHSDTLTVSADSVDGDTAIAVTGTLTDTYGSGSYVVVRIDNYTLQGGIPPFNMPEGAHENQILVWNNATLLWEVYSGSTDGHVLTWDTVNGWQAEAVSLGTIYYQRFRDAGVDKTVRAAANFTDSVRVAFTLTDDSINDETEVQADLVLNSVADGYLSTRGAASVMGRSAATGGNVADIVSTADGQVLRRNGTTLDWGTVVTAGITNSAVTYAKIQNVTATSRVLGRITAGAGVVEELTVANLYTILGITGTAGRNAFFTGANTLTTSGNWLWDNTNNRATITGTIAGSGANNAFLNLNSGAISGSTEFLRMSGNITGNMIGVLSNTNNVAGSNAIYQILIGGATAADPIIQFTISGVVTHSIGVDNSDGDKVKISPNSSTPGGNVDKSLVVTNDATPKYGFNIDTPGRDFDVNSVARSKQWINTSAAPTVTIDTPGTGLGTGGTIDIVEGCNNGWYVLFTTGTAPTAGGVLFTCTFSTPFTTSCFPVMCHGNVATANEWSKFVFNGFSPATVKLKANGTLTASTQYRIQFIATGL